MFGSKRYLKRYVNLDYIEVDLNKDAKEGWILHTLIKPDNSLYALAIFERDFDPQVDLTDAERKEYQAKLKEYLKKPTNNIRIEEKERK